MFSFSTARYKKQQQLCTEKMNLFTHFMVFIGNNAPLSVWVDSFAGYFRSCNATQQPTNGLKLSILFMLGRELQKCLHGTSTHTHTHSEKTYLINYKKRKFKTVVSICMLWIFIRLWKIDKATDVCAPCMQLKCSLSLYIIIWNAVMLALCFSFHIR